MVATTCSAATARSAWRSHRCRSPASASSTKSAVAAAAISAVTPARWRSAQIESVQRYISPMPKKCTENIMLQSTSSAYLR